MTQLVFLIALISAEKRKFTQTLNVGINSSTTENAYTGTTKYLLLCLDCKCIYARCFGIMCRNGGYVMRTAFRRVYHAYCLDCV